MAKPIRIRFVIPTLAKNLRWLEDTIRSVDDQDVPAELVVVAPRDAMIEELVQAYGGTVVAERGSSLSAALNQGFEGLGDSIDYLAWLGDDDLLAPGALATTISALDRSPEASMVLGRLRYIDAENRSKWVLRPGKWSVWYARIGHNFMGQPGSLMRRRHFDAVGGIDESLLNSMDQDLFLRLAQQGPVIYVPIELASFRVHAQSISSQKGSADESKDVSRRHRPQLPLPLDWLLSQSAKFADRILLSGHRRIPHKYTPKIAGKNYYESRTE